MSRVPSISEDEQYLRQAQVLLLRHGQPLDTPPKSFLGHRDPALASQGWQQARSTGRLLQRLWQSGAIAPPAGIWHSDLLRAQQTAQAVVEYAPTMALYSEPALREIDFGSWDGSTFAAIDAQNPGCVAAWFANPMATTPPGGEPLSFVYQRVRTALLRMLRSTVPQETLLIVGHFGSLAMAAGCLLGLSPRQALRVTLRRGACGYIAQGAMQWWGRGHDH